MSVRIQPGDRQPDAAGQGYVPDPYLDRVEDNSEIRSIFAGDPGGDSASDADAERAGPFGLHRPARSGLGRLPGVTQLPWPKVVAFVVLGSLALMLLGVFVVRLAGGSSRTQPAPPAAPKATAGGPAASPSPSPTAPDPAAGGDLDVVSWHGATLPVSEQSGPREFDKVRSSGFSRDETGAALAAVHLSTHLDPYTGPAVFTAVLEEQAVEVPGNLPAGLQAQYEEAARIYRLPEAQIRRGMPVVEPARQIRAWRIELFTPDVVDVDLLVRSTTGEDIYYRVPLVWRSGDWHISLAGATPKRPFEGVPNQDPATFTPFTTGGTTS